jgi:hypothetical protein
MEKVPKNYFYHVEARHFELKGVNRLFQKKKNLHKMVFISVSRHFRWFSTLFLISLHAMAEPHVFAERGFGLQIPPADQAFNGWIHAPARTILTNNVFTAVVKSVAETEP